MALGLEQWREHRVERHLAEQHLHRLFQELELNRQECASVGGGTQASLDRCDRLIGYLEQAIEARRNHRAVPALPAADLKIGADFTFRTAAWDSAKAAGAFRTLPQEQLAELSQCFTLMERMGRIYEADCEQPWFQDWRYLGATLLRQPLDRAPVADLEQYLAGCRRFRFLVEKWGRFLQGFEQQFASTLKARKD